MLLPWLSSCKQQNFPKFLLSWPIILKHRKMIVWILPLQSYKISCHGVEIHAAPSAVIFVHPNHIGQENSWYQIFKNKKEYILDPAVTVICKYSWYSCSDLQLYFTGEHAAPFVSSDICCWSNYSLLPLIMLIATVVRGQGAIGFEL